MSNVIPIPKGQPSFPLVDQWAANMRALARSNRTVEERRRLIVDVALHAGCAPEYLTAKEITAWLCSKPGLKPASASAYMSTLRVWFKWLHMQDVRSDDPTMKVGAVRVPPGSPRPLSDGQVEHLLAVAKRGRMRAYLILAAYQGLRVHEIAKMRGEDIDQWGGLLHVLGKGGVVADIPLHPYTLDIAEKFPRRGWWFPSYDDPAQPVLGNSVSNAVSKFMHTNGVRGTAHQLRHWHATTMLQNGTDVRVVQTMLRHSSIQTTMRYTAVNRQQQQAALASLPLFAVGGQS